MDVLIAVAMTILVRDYPPIFHWILMGIVQHSFDERAAMMVDSLIMFFHVS